MKTDSNSKSHKPIVTLFLILASLALSFGCAKSSQSSVSLTHDEVEGKIDVSINGEYFTSYLYKNPLLKKPVLFPVMTSSGKTVTRGYPLETRPGERVDHFHHYGIWFNHGDVNGVDYWNSGRKPPKEGVRYGIIKHKEIKKMESGETGTIVASMEWIDDNGELILEQDTTYNFRGDENRRIVTHTTTLNAPNRDVMFQDSKEGVFAIRVAREMEVPSDKPAILTGADLKPMAEAVVDNDHVSGHYRNSNGLEGYPEVWGKRAKWMELSGNIEGDPISICMFDDPQNVNHPPHWMARDYGLYGANGLGSAIYTEGAEVLNHVIKKGDSRTFKNEIVITDTESITANQIEGWYNEFVGGH